LIYPRSACPLPHDVGPSKAADIHAYANVQVGMPADCLAMERLPLGFGPYVREHFAVADRLALVSRIVMLSIS
jgi:hypothetical protein